MRFFLTKKDIVALNQEFSNGGFHNEASLDFALDCAKKSDDWMKALSFLVRAILIDHAFEEGNKRTVALLIKAYAECEGRGTYDGEIVRLIKKIVLKNVVSIRKIEEGIRDAIR
jgi:prophage maintenance system killer protein